MMVIWSSSRSSSWHAVVTSLLVGSIEKPQGFPEKINVLIKFQGRGTLRYVRCLCAYFYALVFLHVPFATGLDCKCKRRLKIFQGFPDKLVVGNNEIVQGCRCLFRRNILNTNWCQFAHNAYILLQWIL